MSERCVQVLNETLHELFASRDDVSLLGEDVLDPYGGAFKVTQGLSRRVPRPRADDADLGSVAVRRRGRDGAARAAPDPRDHVRRLRRARLRPDRERDREVPGDVRRPGHRPARRADADGRAPRLRADAQPVAREAPARRAEHRRRRRERVPRPARAAHGRGRGRAAGVLHREQAHVRAAEPAAGGRAHRRARGARDR